MVCSRWSIRRSVCKRPVRTSLMTREVGWRGALRGGRAPRSGLTATTPGWELFPVGSRSAVVRALGVVAERAVMVTGVSSGDDGDGIGVVAGEGDAAAS